MPEAGAGHPAGPERLQRFLARAGVGSRRGCEELIRAGRVMVNGVVVREMGTTVVSERDSVRVDGKAIRPQRTLTLMLHKPAGTVTTLAAIDMGLREYDARRVNGYRLYRRRLTELYRWLARMTLESRRRVPGLEPGRADVIVAGAAVVLQAMEALGFSELKVSDGGLREGVLLDLMARVVGPPVPPAAPAAPAPPEEAPAAAGVAAATPLASPAAGVPVGGDSGEALPE